MRLLLALLLPAVSFFFIGRPWSGILCLFLHLTIIGWIPAAIWAVYALNQYETDKKLRLAGWNR
ncbi:YqaE/Pmp3 family membrane protein [Acidisoma cellulosilytica]|uniref:YqaE/Pmp3 family membrane protein n=1 Tax=Acidisoma cellulosilyticum TaxID=2802395 RepID=A0A963YZ66_9PROT|nr:YqaE/Pmp3 family membrane protein [Acidisoma cellulosilyticum]MCB8879611.1 YqaE/Pmp3 family membrane protein [Acidisoma cellulosilyticum]